MNRIQQQRIQAQGRTTPPLGARVLTWAFNTTHAAGQLLSQHLAHWAQVVHAHPRRTMAATAAVLAGFGVTAFAVATADLDNRPDLQPTIATLDEALPLPQLAAQLDQLDQASLRLFSSSVTRTSDTADSLLRRLGVDDRDAASFLRNDPMASTILTGRTGKMVQAVTDNGKLMSLVVRGPSADPAQVDSHFTRISIERLPESSGTADAQARFGVISEQALLQVHEQMATATIESSLYAAADDARVPDAITNQLAEMFSADIDFRRELRRGDAFTVVYEGHTADGEPITWGGSAGRVLAARFINKGVVRDAVWFETASGKGAYFDLTGRSKNKAFLASPLAFSRVTSGFAMRFHPLLKRWRAHLGVDYGAPTGTPVRTVGDGVVSFAGWQNGYGNVVQVTHSGDRITKYAHLSRIDVRVGQKVEQGSNIGAVGATGWATGPHLHFEFLVKGQHVDPITVARNSDSTEIAPHAAQAYRQLARQMGERLDMASEMQTAGARSGPRFE